MRSHTRCVKKQQGFALIAIAGLLVAASLATATILVKEDRKQTWNPQVDARANFKEIEDYLARYQRNNFSLPCPADFNQSPDSINYGVAIADCSLGNATSGTRRITAGGDAIRVGVLPVRTLGIPSKLATDAWGSRITYAVVEKVTDPLQFDSPYTGITIQNGASAVVATDAAYVLISHGAKADGAYSAKTGLPIGNCNSSVGKDQENCDATIGSAPYNRVFRAADFNGVEGADFSDDIVGYRSVDMVAVSSSGGSASSSGTYVGGTRPCKPPRTASPFTWGAACSGSFVNVVHGATQTIGNATPEYSGSADVRCNDGTFEIVISTCAYTPSCPAATENWVGTVAGCSGARGTLAHGASTSITNTTGGRTGSVNASCTMGVISQSAASCSGNSCTLPWGGSIAHGASISAFQSSSVPCGSSCASEVRTCNFGVLSGSFTNQSCNAAACSNCTAPWGATVPHNSSITAFQAASVPCGSGCNSETRSCWNGALSGSYTNQSCSAAVCNPCGLPWGGSISHGASVTAYNTWNAGCGGTCFSEARYCNNGSLSGSYGAASCSAPCASCALPWGGSIGHGGSVAAYTQVCSSSTSGGSSSSDGGGADAGGGPGDGGGGGDGGAMLEAPSQNYASLYVIPKNRSEAQKTTADFACRLGEEEDFWSKLLVPTQGDGGDASSSGGGWYSTCVGETRWCSNGTLTGSYPYSNCGVGVVACGGTSTSGGGDGGDGGGMGADAGGGF